MALFLVPLHKYNSKQVSFDKTVYSIVLFVDVCALETTRFRQDMSYDSR